MPEPGLQNDDNNISWSCCLNTRFKIFKNAAFGASYIVHPQGLMIARHALKGMLTQSTFFCSETYRMLINRSCITPNLAVSSTDLSFLYFCRKGVYSLSCYSFFESLRIFVAFMNEILAALLLI